MQVNRKGFFPIIILIAIFILVLVIGGIYFLSQKNVFISQLIQRVVLLIPNKYYDTANWRIYKNAMYGYSLRYPTDWVWAVEEFSGCSSCSDPVSFLAIRPTALAHINESLDDPFVYIWVYDERNDPVASTVKLELATNNTIDEKLVSRNVEPYETGVFRDMIRLSKGQYHYYIQLRSPLSREQYSRTIFNQILSAFRFDEALQANQISLGAQKEISDTADWKTYANATFAYSIQYPADYNWGSKESASSSEVSILGPTNKEGQRDTILIVLSTISGAGFRKLSENFVLDNVPAERSIYKEPRCMENISARKGEWDYYIYEYSPEWKCDKSATKKPDENEKLFDQILSTFKFLE